MLRSFNWVHTMKHALACLLLLSACLACTGMPPVIKVQADGESDKVKAFERRPFDDHIQWDEARVQVGKALKGDQEAREKIAQGGLSYWPLIKSDPSDAAQVWAYNLLAKHIGWLNDMQSWERTLLRPDANSALALFLKLRDRFHDSGPQLARAIILAARLGDSETLTKLLALDPESKWVKAARAYLGLGFEPRAAVNILIATLEDIRPQRARTMQFETPYIETRNRKLGILSEKYMAIELQTSFEETGIDCISALPKEWETGGVTERAAALAADTNDATFIAECCEKVAQICGEDPERDGRYLSFRSVAMQGLKNTLSPDPASLEHWATNSTGPTLALWAKSRQNSGIDIECALAAIAQFNGHPDLGIAQRFCLSQCLAYPDEITGLMAIRAVLALRDDCYDAFHNVACELSSNENWKSRSKAYAVALLASGHRKLVELAKLVESGNSKNLTETTSTGERLGLSLEQRAAILQVFVHADENAGHGGAIGVYWLNRAAFLEGACALVDAADCYAAAIVEAAKFTKRDFANVNTFLWAGFLERRLDAACLEPILKKTSAKYPDLAKILAAEKALSTDTERKMEDRALYLANDLKGKKGGLDDSLYKILTNDLSRAGGFGLNAAGWCKRADSENPTGYELLARSERASPLILEVQYQRGPGPEKFGAYGQGNWETAARSALRQALLMPTSILTLVRAGTVLAVQGSPGVALSAMFANSCCRPMHRFLGYSVVRLLSRFPSSYWNTARWLEETASAWGADIPEEWKPGFLDTRKRCTWTTDCTEVLWYISDIGLRPEYVQRSFDMIYERHDDRDVNNLLNYSLALGRNDAKRALELIKRSEALGVNQYGRFVGSQTYVRAKAQLGEIDDALKRYTEMRGQDIGRPEFLDRYLLLGMTEGNQFARMDDVLDALSEYELDFTDSQLCFGYRRALMSSGHHADLLEVPAPTSDPKSYAFSHAFEFSRAFHEARARLDQSDFTAISLTTDRLLGDRRFSASIGVMIDALLLNALADKELGLEKPAVNKEGKLDWLHESWHFSWPGDDCLLEHGVLDVLAGARPWNELPKPDSRHFWHGSRYAERPSISNGSGLLSAGECEARDPFIRGVLAYLSGQNDKARELLTSCVALDQRCSHEFHVAQWILAQRLSEKKKEK